MEPYTYESENGITLVTIKGRTYRKAPVSALKDRRRGESSSAGQDGAGSKRRKAGRRAAAGFGDEEGADDVERLTEELCDAPSSAIDEEALALDIRKEGELFTYRMHVPSAFFGNIIGKGGQMRTRLQTETGATITVPKQGSTSEDISTDPLLFIYLFLTFFVYITFLFISIYFCLLTRPGPWLVQSSRRRGRRPSCRRRPGSTCSCSRYSRKPAA